MEEGREVLTSDTSLLLRNVAMNPWQLSRQYEFNRLFQNDRSREAQSRFYNLATMQMFM
jgi:hypothetical protein